MGSAVHRKGSKVPPFAFQATEGRQGSRFGGLAALGLIEILMNAEG